MLKALRAFLAGAPREAAANDTQAVDITPRLKAAEDALNSGRDGEAERLLLEVLRERHDSAEAHLLLGVMHHRRGEHEDAQDRYALAQCFAEGWWPVHLHQGLLALERGQPDAAVVAFERALALGARDARVHNGLGAAYTHRERLSEAVSQFEAALALDPTLAHAHSNLGYILFRDLEDYERGAHHIARAVELAPDDVSILCNRAMVLQHDGRPDEALALWDSILEREPELAEAHISRAFHLLARGDYEAGWLAYAARSQLPRNTWPQNLPWPDWNGSDLRGKTIFVFGEQGLGDEIMFASCLPDLLQTGARCVVECNPKLIALFTRSFPEALVVAKDDWRNTDALSHMRPDFKVALGSLPRFFRPSLQSFPAHAGYLHADAGRIAAWRERLALLPGRQKIGISWRGGAPSTRRTTRSIPLSDCGLLLALPDVAFVSLQYGDCAAEIAAAEQSTGVRVHHWSEAIEDYDETAALVSALDLVVSVQTAVVHLAGALNRPGCALISAVPEWRYGTSGAAMPWYPSVRLLRQSTLGEWQPVLEAAAREVTKNVTL